jgi:hypothetical protein
MLLSDLHGYFQINAALKVLHFEPISEAFQNLAGLTACLPALYLLLNKRGVIDSSRGKWSDRMGEGRGKRQFPEQREPERVRA